MIFLIYVFLSIIAHSQENTKTFCEAFHSSVCPQICVRKCIPSCNMCQDCDGPGSCTYEGKNDTSFNINQKQNNNFGRTAIMVALSRRRSKAQIEKLIALGANLQLTDDEGGTPLLYANLDTKNLDTINLLIKNGANIKAQNKFGAGVVSKSSCFDHKIYQYWKEKNLDLSQSTKDGANAISTCLSVCNIEGLRYLINQGVKPPKDWKNLVKYCPQAEKFIEIL